MSNEQVQADNGQQGIQKTYSMRNLPKMHYQLYMWLYCFQNYKMLTVNIDIKLNISENMFLF